MSPLLIMYILLIPCAALFVYTKYREHKLLAALFKGVATWIIVGAALASTLPAYGATSVFALLIIAGLVMGLAGDVALALPRPGFEAGMVFFGLGHCCYIAALLRVTAHAWWSIPAFIVIYAVLIYLYRKSGLNPKGLLMPVIVYSIIVTVMLSLAVTMPFTVFPLGLILLLAAALFAVSDALLAKNGFDSLKNLDAVTFNLTPVERGIISLACYFLGQSLFAVSLYCF